VIKRELGVLLVGVWTLIFRVELKRRSVWSRHFSNGDVTTGNGTIDEDIEDPKELLEDLF